MKVQPKTEPIRLELPMRIYKDANDFTHIVVGGGQQPEWHAKGSELEDAIAELVRMTSEDAIADEAREWQQG